MTLAASEWVRTWRADEVDIDYLNKILSLDI